MSHDAGIPKGLVDDINAGNCVAFVGAGFSAAASLPTWTQLLRGLVEVDGLDSAVSSYVQDVIAREHPSAHQLDQAAQLLEDSLGRDRFIRRLRKLLHADLTTETIKNRVKWLLNIPFRAIVTTNFDPILNGAVPGPEAYRDILRPRKFRWWEKAFWDEQGTGAPVVKLHGDLRRPDAESTVVLTRRDYRRRLYEDAGYMTFLRGLLSSNTILFMGFSFEDAYLNELRSQVLALFDYGRSARGPEKPDPLAYAILGDVPELVRLHFARHEGIEVLGFDTKEGKDYSGFDAYLKHLWEGTAILPRFGRLLENKRILWVDAQPRNNDAGFKFLQRAITAYGHKAGKSIDAARNANEALTLLGNTGIGPYDLVISHWGHQRTRDENGNPENTAIKILRHIRNTDIRCPVIIFSTAQDAEERKRLCLNMGAQAYCYDWEDLFRNIARILAD